MIPRTMSTQHPDNVRIPFFAESTVLKGDDEIKEAYYVFSHLGCQEQMWDYEGKEVDDFVVKKLLSRYGDFFSDKVLGKDLRLTLRVPNPSWERAEAKILLETLESIPRSFDAAKIFYEQDVAPIYEVILPMVTSHVELNRVFYYYKNFVVGKQSEPFFDGDVTIAEWIGEFKPYEINLIPLIEDLPFILRCDDVVENYMADKSLECQRVFLAKSDLALNYGLLTSTLALRIGLKKLEALEERTSVRIYPIIGFGSSPFRGNLRPDNTEKIVREWRNVQTFTIQSSFKYDFSAKEATKAIQTINESRMKKGDEVEEEQALDLIKKTSEEYRKTVTSLVDLVNRITPFVPKRRERKLHIGLFGYSRSLNGSSLPRAIPFCCSLYSIGLPPEIFGLSSLNDRDFERVAGLCEDVLKDALRFYNPAVERILPKEALKRIDVKKISEFIDYEPDHSHLELTGEIIGNLGNISEEKIISAANVRKFLG
jgi:phosphoenolpyruvate carboxylase